MRLMIAQIKLSTISNCLMISTYMTGSKSTIDGGWLIKNGHAILNQYNIQHSGNTIMMHENLK